MIQNKHHNDIKSGLSDNFINGRILRAKQYCGENLNKNDIVKLHKDLAQRIENGTASNIDILYYSETMHGKKTRSSPYHKKTCKDLNRFIKTVSGVNFEELSQHSNGCYYEDGCIAETRPDNLTRALDARISRSNEKAVYKDVYNIYLAFKGIGYSNGSGTGQEDQLNEMKLLISHAPEINSGEALDIIIDGNYNNKENRIKDMQELALELDKNCHIFNSTGNYIKYLKKLI